MAREKATYRDNLELLKEFFPGKMVISIDEAARFIGCCRNTVVNNYGRIFKNGRTTIANFAREISV